MRRLLVTFAASAVVAGAFVPTLPAKAVQNPNVIFIITDDHRFDAASAAYMPETVAATPTNFVNGFVSNPVCCPSRSTVLSGLYSHDNKVWSNQDDYFGGWPAFRKWDNQNKSMPEAVDAQGYHTGLFGKFLNGWDGTVPSGWDVFDSTLNGTPQQPGGVPYQTPYYDYREVGTWDGEPLDIQHRELDSDYSGYVFGDAAERFVTESPEGEPYFLYYSPNAPHGTMGDRSLPAQQGGDHPPIPAPEDVDAPVAAIPTIGPAYNEADMSDKPEWLKHHQKIDGAENHEWLVESARSVYGVDREVGQIIDAAEARDPGLANTVIIFMGDNGYSNGAHRWMPKMVPYEEGIRVPFRAYFPPGFEGAPATGDNPEITLNLDVAATIVDVAGGTLQTPDALSMLDPASRQNFVIEGSVELPDRSFCGVRTQTAKFIRLRTGETEYYNLVTDPHELTSRPAQAPARIERLAKAGCTTPLPPGWKNWSGK